MKVAVICLNSSWLCGRHKDADGKVSDYGKLILGELQADKAFQQTKAADIFIGVMHHPLNWLKESDRNRIQEILSQKCDFILHGHEHRPGINVLESILGDVITIPAGAAWDRRYQDDPRYVSAYNFVHIDLEKREGTIFLREWNDEAHAWDKDDGLWPEGQYRFSLPARDAERSSEARDAARRVKHRFLRALGRRFLEDMEVHVRHVLEKHGNLQVVREVARFKIRVRAGQKETLCIKEDKNGALQAAVKQSGLDLCTCTFSYFKVMGQPITPMRDDDECTVHICKLAYGEQDIEFERTKYYPDRGSSSFVTGRFCKRFKIRFKREKRLDYEFHSLGGFPKLDPCPNEILDVEEVVVEDLCFSDQGYLIQWFPPTTRKVSRSRKAGVIP